MKKIIPVITPVPKIVYTVGDIVDDGKARYQIDRVEGWEVFSTNLDTGRKECFWDTAYLDYYIREGRIKYEPKESAT